MLGLLRPYIESFDLNRYPHEFPKKSNPLFTDKDLMQYKLTIRGQNSHTIDTVILKII